MLDGWYNSRAQFDLTTTAPVLNLAGGSPSFSSWRRGNRSSKMLVLCSRGSWRAPISAARKPAPHQLDLDSVAAFGWLDLFPRMNQASARSTDSGRSNGYTISWRFSVITFILYTANHSCDSALYGHRESFGCTQRQLRPQPERRIAVSICLSTVL